MVYSSEKASVPPRVLQQIVLPAQIKVANVCTQLHGDTEEPS